MILLSWLRMFMVNGVIFLQESVAHDLCSLPVLNQPWVDVSIYFVFGQPKTSTR